MTNNVVTKEVIEYLKENLKISLYFVEVGWTNDNKLTAYLELGEGVISQDTVYFPDWKTSNDNC